MQTISHGHFATYTPSQQTVDDMPLEPVSDAEAEAWPAAFADWQAQSDRANAINRQIERGLVPFARTENGEDWHQDVLPILPRDRFYGLVLNNVVTTTARNPKDLAPAGGLVVSSTEEMIVGQLYNGETGEVFTHVPTLADIRAEVWHAVQAFAEDTRQKLAGRPSALKATSWPMKAERARRILGQAGTPDMLAMDASIVQAECTRRGKGETVAELCQTILQREAALGAATAMIDGMESAAWEMLEAVDNPADFEAVVVQLKTDAAEALAELQSNG